MTHADLFKKHYITKPVEVDVTDLLKNQKRADDLRAKVPKRQWRDVLSKYLSQFIKPDGSIDFAAIDKDISENEKVYRRHVGELKTDFLKLLSEPEESETKETPAIQIKVKPGYEGLLGKLLEEKSGLISMGG